MVYALIGIPLTMLLLTAVVERLLIPTTILLKWMNTKLGHLHTPFFIRVLHLIIVSPPWLNSYSWLLNSTALFCRAAVFNTLPFYFLITFTDPNDGTWISFSCTSSYFYGN